MKWFVCRLLACAVVIATCPVPAEAGDPTFHPVANLSNSANRTSDFLDIATDGAHVYSVWREQPAPGAEELRFRVSNNHGASFIDGPSGRTILSVASPHQLFNVRIAGAGGTVLVLFSTGEDETNAQFWVLRSTDGGASFAPPVDVSGVDAARQGDIAINGAGEAHIVMENVASGEIHHRRSTDGGATFLAAVNISGTADISGNPRVSVNGSNVAVVWEETGPDGTSPAEAAFAFSGDAGASFGPALNLSASAAPSEAPDVAILDAVHVAWVEDGSVHYRRSADGATFTGAIAVGAPPAGDVARTPALSGVGPLLNVAWTTVNPSGSDGPFLRRSEDGGVNFGSTFDLGSAGGPFDAVAIGGGSPVKIAWPHSPSGFPAESDVLFLREIACSNTWLTAVSDVWTNAARWSSGAVPGSTDDVCLTVAGSYTVTVRGDQSANSVVVGAAGGTGAVLRIEGQRPGTGATIPGTLTVGNGLTNFGRITLTSIGTIVSGEARLTVSSGTLTNASGGTIETLQGNQGVRTINATAVNDGTISFGWLSTLNGNWTNNNSVTLASGITLTLGAAAAFSQDNGSLTLTGTLVSTGGIFNYNGGEITGTPLVLTSASLNFGPASTGGGTFRMRRDSNLSGDIASAQTVLIEAERIGTGAAINATLTAAGDFINAGTIQLTSIGTITSGTATLAVPAGSVLTIASTGRIESIQGAQGGRVLSGGFSNNGTVHVSWPMTIGGTNAIFTNNNSFIVDSGDTLSMAGSDDRFVQDAGTLDVNGTFDMVGGTFDFNGGTVDTTTGSAGLVILETSALNFGPVSTGAAHFRMRRISTLSGNIAAGQIVTIEAERIGTGAGINAIVTGIGNVTNGGAIQLTSIGTVTSGTATLTMAGGAVLTNASGGLIETLQGAQGGRDINGHVVNNGTIVIGWSAELGGMAATHTNNGHFQVQSARTLSIVGDETFVQGGGTLEVDGTFHMTGATFNFNGGSVDASAGTAILESSALNFGPDSTGPGHLRVRRISTLSGNIAAGQTVTIEAERIGTGAAINATVTASSDFTNGGTIQLTSIGTVTSGTATLAMAGSSVMTISSTGRVETLQGAQGGRVINGSFVNNGTVVIAWSASLAGANATYTNNGSFVVNDARTLTIAVASSTFVQGGGTLDIEGTVNMNGATFNFNGGTVDAVGGLGNLQNAVLNFGAGSTGAAHFRLRRDSTLTGNIAPGQTVTIEAERIGTGAAINATVTVVGNLTNAGTIQLTSIGTITSGTAILTVADGAVLTNATTGRIETLQGAQGGRVINGHVVNNGTIVIGWSAELGGMAATHTNNGHFQVQSARTLSIGGDETFVQGGGTLEVDGTFHMTGGTFNFNGGSVDTSAGSAILESSALNFGPGSTGPGHLRVRRISTLSGNIAAGQTVTIEAERIGTGAAINATVTVIGNSTNAGTIQLTSVGTITSGTATLTVADGAVLTSASTGRIETLQGAQGGRAINGHVVNNGAIVIGWSASLGGTAAIYTNNGLFHVQTSRTLSIPAGETFVQGGGTLEVDGTFDMTGATFNFNGGSVDASVGLAILETSALNFGPGSTGAAHFRVRRISTLSGNIAAGQTVTIEAERIGTGAAINATVTVIGNVTNAGTIQLTSIGTVTSGTSTLAVGAGAVLTNASTGRIETLQGAQGSRTVTGSVRNEGTLAVIWPATYNSGTFRNVSPGSITGGGSLTLGAASMFFGTGSVTANISNSGQFNAGQSPGALNITGNFTQTATGSLNVEIGGFTAGTEYDLITVSGAATLAGTLNISLFGGFCEAGGPFDVLTYTGGSGDFTAKNGLNQGGLVFTAVRNSAFYRLNATGACVSAPIANNDAYSVNEDGVLTVAAPGVLANDTDPQGTALTAILFTSPSHGEVLLNPDGSFTYTPAADFFGTDSFAYVANDGFENSAPATVMITVNAVNDPPNAVDDSAIVDEDSGQNSVAVLANDETAPDAGETLTITAVTQGTGGAVVITGGGSGLTYAPNANFSGIDTFTYTVSDGVFTDVATVSVQVNAINDPPDAIDDAATVEEDSGANTIAVLANDTTGGEAGETLSIDAVTQGANGVVAIGGGGTSVAYTPGPNFNGSDSFTYTVADGNGGTDTAVVHVTVASVNDPPEAIDDAFNADEDSGASQIDVLTNDTAAPDGGEILQVTAVTQGAHGSVAISAGGTNVLYTPGAEFSGSDSFTYTVSDGNGGVDTATVLVTVNGVNDPPDAVDDTASVQEDSAANVIGVLANDTFTPDTGETLVITEVTQGANGTVAIEEGWITYTPHANFVGDDSFTYTISDGNGGVDTATVTVTVTNTNDPPTADDDTATADEDGGAISVDVLANDGVAPDAGETLAITAATPGANGSVAITGGGTAVTYTPNADFAGSDSFTYSISDGNGGVDTATVIVTVNSVNDPPDANDDSAGVDEDSGAASIDVLANDSFAPDAGETLTITAVTQGANGSVAITAGGARVTYTPNAQFGGNDSFTYTISDGNGGSDTATVTIVVHAVNDPPNANDDAASVDEDSGATSVNVLANDGFAPDAGETLTITAVTQGANGSVAITGGGSAVSYTPNANFAGSDGFTYTISDGNGGVDMATVSVTVNSVNDPPDANSDTAIVGEDSMANVIAVLANDSSAPDAGETLVVTAVTPGAHGSVAVTGGGTVVTYTPNANFAGTDSFSYAISDGNGGADTATVTVTVSGVNDPPDAVDEAATVQEDSAANVIDVLANDSFAPDAGETLVVTAVTQGTHGTVVVDEGSVTYTPHANFAGVDTFTYTISDGNGGVDTAVVTVTVGSVNDAPDANDDSATVDENSGATSIDVLANDTDGPDSGETLVVAAITQGANGSVAITGAGSAVTYLPNANFSGIDEFTYTVADGHGGTDTATVRVTVRPVNTTDADEDGVPDDVDQCPGTPAGTVVNATGCAISQICSAAAPWKNHGQYVSCVSNTSAQFEILGLITAAQRNAMVSAAAKSNVGKK